MLKYSEVKNLYLNEKEKVQKVFRKIHSAALNCPDGMVPVLTFCGTRQILRPDDIDPENLTLTLHNEFTFSYNGIHAVLGKECRDLSLQYVQHIPLHEDLDN